MVLKQRIIGLNLLGVAAFAIVLGVLAARGLDRTIDGVVVDVNSSLLKEKRPTAAATSSPTSPTA